MQEHMRLTLGIDPRRDADGDERPWHDDLRGVVGYVRALAERVDVVEAALADSAGKPIRTVAPSDAAPGLVATLHAGMRAATGRAPREPALVRTLAEVLAGPGDARRARDEVVRNRVVDLQLALGLYADGHVTDGTLLAVAALHAGLKTPVDG